MKARVILRESTRKCVRETLEVGVPEYLPLSDFLMGENAAIRSADGSGSTASSLVVSGAHDLDAGHLGTRGLLFDVLNRELATRGLHLSEAVRLGPVGGSSLVRDSSIQHI